MAILEGMPSIRMISPVYEPVSDCQGLARENSIFKPHKPLPPKRDTTISSITSPDLRAQYQSSSSVVLDGEAHTNGTHEQPGPSLIHSPTPPVLPPTPPSANHESSEYSHDESSVADTTILRSGVVTPVKQQTPLTPDQTPPRFGKDLAVRPWLATQPSLASTRAESFATAREHFQSDNESEHSTPYGRRSHSRNASHHDIPPSELPRYFHSVPRPLANITPRTPQAIWEDDEIWKSHEAEYSYPQENIGTSFQDIYAKVYSQEQNGAFKEPVVFSAVEEYSPQRQDREFSGELDGRTVAQDIMLQDRTSVESPSLRQHAFVVPKMDRVVSVEKAHDTTSAIESSISFGSRLRRSVSEQAGSPGMDPTKRKAAPRRGPSLRERLEAVDRVGPSISTENFGDQIGWSESKDNSDGDRQKSWRLSDISAVSAVGAMVIDNECKRMKTIRRQTKTDSLRIASSPLPNSNRNSILTNPYASPDSTPRHSLSHKKARLSNRNRLSYGSEASRSLSMSFAAASSKNEVIRVAVIPQRRSSLQSSAKSNHRHFTPRSISSSAPDRFPSLRRAEHTHRVSSDSASLGSCSVCAKHKRGPPPVPPRASSLSAPTSHNNSLANSRSNSVTSEHLRIHRMQAEHDLRKTLDRMESERMAPTLKAATAEAQNSAKPTPTEPGTRKWKSPGPVSVINGPLSPTSILTASGDGASIGEARAVNLFPHNNDSLQLIEKDSAPESRAVTSLRHTTLANDLSILTDGPPSPQAIVPAVPAMDSPLRNPREPPPTPVVRAGQPTLAATPSLPMTRFPSQRQSSKHYSSPRRPSLDPRRHSDSFIRSMTRGLSLKNARNPKSDSPQLDENMTPMWQPRRFWDDAEYTEDENEARSEEDGGVPRSLDMSQYRTVKSGPVMPGRNMSANSRTQNQRRTPSRFLYKQSSYGSASHLRTVRKLYRVPGFRGVYFHFSSLGAWQERMKAARSRKEDERRDIRRRMLRDAIGPHVISHGDSRFPEAMAISGTGQTNGNGEAVA